MHVTVLVYLSVPECVRVCKSVYVLVCKNVSECVCVCVSESEGQEYWKQVSSTPLASCHEQPQARSRQGQLRSNFVRW